MNKYAIIKQFSKGPVEMYRYTVSNGSLYDSDNFKKGAPAMVVKGRKLKKGTIVKMKRMMEDRYGSSFRSIWSGKLMNPVVLVELEDGSTAWVKGENIACKFSELNGYVDTISAASEDAAKAMVESLYKNNTGVTYAFEKGKVGGTIYKYTFDMTDCGTSVYKNYLADCGDTWAMVEDDWRSDTYQFLAFTKKPKLNNLTGYESTGTSIRFTDMQFDGCTGIETAIAAFNDYVAKHNGKLIKES